MLMLMAALILPIFASQAQSAPKAVTADTCTEMKFHRADEPLTPHATEPLNRQPLAREEKTVMYREGKCVSAILVQENVGTEQR
ncbi:hypothetical protein [Sphingomonas sp. AX6]|uniref:hypothetical protein n=1 Tax=Sphingomonas sp. AX6 TaxID=2653171 RepID=UPI0012EF1AEF|nr:hypothetical protein [Sphingomonas sp. AX6]VXC82622.1 exported hypothetical protein [Sphingomonas sp. AX6]